MKSLKIWVTLGVVVIICAIIGHGFITKHQTNQKVDDKSLNNIVLDNTQNDPNNNLPITQNMNITTQQINIGNGLYVPVGTYEAPIPLADGQMHTDYLITGMITSNQAIPVYNNILEGSSPFKEYPAGTNLLVIGYVDGYFILGSAAGDVDGLGYKTDTFVSAKNMTLIPNESNLQALTLGNSPYKVNFEYPGAGQSYKLYEYPTDLSKVVGEITSRDLSYNTADNTADILNTANKMNDVDFKGHKGWMLTSDNLQSQYIGTAKGASSNNGSTT